MRTPTLLLILFVLASLQAAWSQTARFPGKNPHALRKNESLTDSRVLPVKVDSMHGVLKGAASNKERADICFAFSRYYADRLKIDSALYYSARVKKESEEGNYELGMAKYYISRSHALYFRSIQEPEGLNKGIEIIKKYKDLSLSGFAYRVLARQYFQLEDMVKARQYFHRSIEYFIAANYPVALQFVYYELGNSFSQSYERDSAAFYLVKALELAEEIKDPSRIVMAAKGLSELYLATDDLSNASRYMQYALDSRIQGTNSIFNRILLSDYIDVSLRLGNFSKAEALIKEYEKANGELGDNYGNLALLNIKGKYYFHKKKYDEAIPLLRKAFIGLNMEGRSTMEMKRNAWYLGQAELATSQYDSAIARFSFLLKLDNEMANPVSLPEANLFLSQAYEQKGNKDLALYYLRSFNHLKDSMDQVKKNQTFMELTTKYETEKKEQQIALLEKENLLQKAISNSQAQRNKFAYLLIGAILIFSGLIYYRYTRTRKLSAQLANSLVELKQAQDQLVKTEKEKEAENIRVRISRDIHDEVGATLSGVALFSEIAREKMKQHKEDDAQVYLEHITENSKEMVDKMSDIVWAINPENDSVDRIIAKIQSYAFNICAGKGISFHTKIDEGIRNYFPSMQVKRNLYLFLKEAINNAVKYSEGSNILLILQKTPNQVKAEVRDDGKGFDPFRKNEGNGLTNMKARAGSLGGNFTINSTPGNGTIVSLAFNFHPAGGLEATI